MNISTPNKSIYRFQRDRAIEGNYENNIAITYFGVHITYKTFYKEIHYTAASFKSQGIREGDVITILSANIPEALISFYAINKIGAILGFIESKWGFLFLIVFPSLLAFLREIFELIMEMKGRKEE